MEVVSLMCLKINLKRKIAAQNVGSFFVYFCYGQKINFQLQIRSSFNKKEELYNITVENALLQCYPVELTLL